MAIIYDVIIVAHDEVSANAQADLIAEAGQAQLAGLKLKDYFKRITSGIRPGVVQTKVAAVKASGTVTLAAHVATNTVTINGVVLTAVSGAAGADQYDISGGMTTGAASLAAAINANTTLDGMVVATSNLAVVTVTALLPGEIGNAVTLAISANGSVSAARMSGGTNGDAERTHYYGSAS